MCEASGIAYIDVKENSSPFDLVAEWFEEARQNGIQKPIFNLATCTKAGKVSNRSLVLLDFVNNKFRFVTNERSLKGHDMEDNPVVAACFLFNYLKDGKRSVSRQIRCQGSVTKLPYEETAKYYENDALFAQIRSHICMQGETVEWNEQKRKYDKLLKEVQGGLKLKMPEYQAGYAIISDTVDFYESSVNQIADRIIFKQCDDNSWTFHRVAA